MECLARQPAVEKQWTLQWYDSLADELHLSALGLRLPLTELYARVKLGLPPQVPREINANRRFSLLRRRFVMM